MLPGRHLLAGATATTCSAQLKACTADKTACATKLNACKSCTTSLGNAQKQLKTCTSSLTAAKAQVGAGCHGGVQLGLATVQGGSSRACAEVQRKV